MFDDLAAQFYDDVVQSYLDYRSTREGLSDGRSKDMRLALSSATSLFHFREHLPDSIRKTKAETITLCPEYRYIADITNIAKHRKLTDKKAVITSVDDLTELSLCIEYEDDEGRYTNMQKIVLVKISGDDVDIINLLTKVMNFWGNTLFKAGVIHSYTDFTIPNDPKNIIVPRDKVNVGWGETIVPGLRFSVALQLMKYNDEKKIAEPVNLDGGSMNLSVYKEAPRYHMDIVTTIPTGDKLTLTIDLDEEEASRYSAQHTEEQKEKFRKWLFNRRDSEINQKLKDEVEKLNKRKLQYIKIRPLDRSNY